DAGPGPAQAAADLPAVVLRGSGPRAERDAPAPWRDGPLQALREERGPVHRPAPEAGPQGARALRASHPQEPRAPAVHALPAAGQVHDPGRGRKEPLPLHGPDPAQAAQAGALPPGGAAARQERRERKTEASPVPDP